MRVLALASQKGGSGKTTLSGHLAMQAQMAGGGPVVPIERVVLYEEVAQSAPAAVAPEPASLPLSLPNLRAAGRGKAAFTLRPDPHRRLGLRLASAVTRRSGQVLVTEALDGFLLSLPEVEQVARRCPQPMREPA